MRVSLDSCGHDLVQFPVPHEISLDHFDGESLAYCWNYLRNPHRKCYRLAQRKSCLTLYGNSFDISDLESPALLSVRRQRHLLPDPRQNGFLSTKGNQEAGILILATNLFYYKLSKRLMNGQSFICVEKRADDFCQIAACVPAPAGEVTLHIEATRSHYHFYYSGDHKPIYLASASTRFLACEVIGRSFYSVYMWKCSLQEKDSPACLRHILTIFPLRRLKKRRTQSLNKKPVWLFITRTGFLMIYASLIYVLTYLKSYYRLYQGFIQISLLLRSQRIDFLAHKTQLLQHPHQFPPAHR